MLPMGIKHTFGQRTYQKIKKMMKHFMTSGLLSILFLACGMVSAKEPRGKKDTPLPPNQQQIVLKFNLQPGDKYLFSSAMNQNIVQDMMGQQMNTTQNMVSDYLYDIQSIENGITTINVTFSTIKMDMDIAGMQRVSYDSNDPDAATSELKALSNLVGQSFLMQVDATGSVQKIDGLAEIIASVDGQQAEMLKQSFGDSSMIQNMNQLINIYPNKNVGPGDSWIKTFSGPIAGIMQSEASSTFSLAEIEGDLAILNTDGQMSFSKIEGLGANPMLQGAEFNLTGTQTGTLEVDIKSGLPVSTKLKQNITGDIDVQGFQIPMTIVSEMTITGKKL